MRLAFGTDERGPLTDKLVASLKAAGHEVEVLAPGEEWPEVGRNVGQAVAAGRAERGIVCCHTGTGVSIAANKVEGVRAALCGDVETARGARRWNDANVLALGLANSDPDRAVQIVDAFLNEPSDPTEAPAVARVEQ
ncbi:MAG: RpiB/LacA/LacB family sugar-phosphate isomerase [Actinobacteria bacterium]|nr:RpiB/LacA/LacB family sugar-phosphate isomerase [Actinomycetota bacterium]